MSRKTMGIVLIILGVILAVISLAADLIGLGSGGFGLSRSLEQPSVSSWQLSEFGWY